MQLGKARPRKALENLFVKFGIEPWTPHDTRRTLTTFLSEMGLGGATSAILGHKIEGKKVPERELTAKVTEAHYNTSQKITLKADGVAV
jgi:integrase